MTRTLALARRMDSAVASPATRLCARAVQPPPPTSARLKHRPLPAPAIFATGERMLPSALPRRPVSEGVRVEGSRELAVEVGLDRLDRVLAHRPIGRVGRPAQMRGQDHVV